MKTIEEICAGRSDSDYPLTIMHRDDNNTGTTHNLTRGPLGEYLIDWPGGEIVECAGEYGGWFEVAPCPWCPAFTCDGCRHE